MLSPNYVDMCRIRRPSMIVGEPRINCGMAVFAKFENSRMYEPSTETERSLILKINKVYICLVISFV